MQPTRFILFLLFLMLAAVGCRPGGELSALPETLAAPTPFDSTLEPQSTLPNPGDIEITPDSPAATLPPSPTGTPSPTPAPVLRRLTAEGCCVAPFWSPASDGLLFLDRPAPDAPAGIWRVDLQGSAPTLYSDREGVYSPDMALLAYPANGETFVERLATGEQWRIPNGGRSIAFSIDGTLVAWTAGQTGPPFDTALREVWISRSDGTAPRQVFSAVRGGFAGWFPDGRLLVSGLDEPEKPEQVLWVLDLAGSPGDPASRVELGRGGRVREAKISPDGSWLAYLVTASAAPEQNGLWVADTQTGTRQRLELFGAFQWRDAENLLVVPLDLSQPVHRLEQIHVPTGAVELLTDPVMTPFRISNGDWSVSPDGAHVGFVSADDGNIWLLSLPPAG